MMITRFGKFSAIAGAEHPIHSLRHCKSIRVIVRVVCTEMLNRFLPFAASANQQRNVRLRARSAAIRWKRGWSSTARIRMAVGVCAHRLSSSCPKSASATTVDFSYAMQAGTVRSASVPESSSRQISQLTTDKVGAFVHPRAGRWGTGARPPSTRICWWMPVSVVPGAQQKLLRVIVDLHFDYGSPVLPEGIAQCLAASGRIIPYRV